MRSAWSSSLVFGLALSALSACARPPAPSSAEGVPEVIPPVLLPVDTLEGSIVMRQEVRVRWEDREDGFEAVLQKTEGELALVGLGPMGTVAFVLRMTDAGISLDNRSGREVPFRPAHILADVQRVFYPWFDGPAACAACERSGSVRGLAIHERHSAGRLVERRFTHPEAPERGAVVVTYHDWAFSGRAPERVELRNEWYGYGLTIHTLEVSRPVPERGGGAISSHEG